MQHGRAATWYDVPAPEPAREPRNEPEHEREPSGEPRDVGARRHEDDGEEIEEID